MSKAGGKNLTLKPLEEAVKTKASLSKEEQAAKTPHSALSRSVLSQKQIAELVDLFSVFDIHEGRSGHEKKMHCRDLRVAARILGVELSREQLQSLVTLYSAEGQFFTQEEFIEIATELVISKPESDQKESFLQSSFNLFDSHGSGVVTAKQLHKTLLQLNSAAAACEAGVVDDLTEEDLEEMIRDLDKDGLGLTKANFVDLLSESSSIM